MSAATDDLFDVMFTGEADDNRYLLRGGDLGDGTLKPIWSA